MSCRACASAGSSADAVLLGRLSGYSYLMVLVRAATGEGSSGPIRFRSFVFCLGCSCFGGCFCCGSHLGLACPGLFSVFGSILSPSWFPSLLSKSFLRGSSQDLVPGAPPRVPLQSSRVSSFSVSSRSVCSQGGLQVVSQGLLQVRCLLRVSPPGLLSGCSLSFVWQPGTRSPDSVFYDSMSEKCPVIDHAQWQDTYRDIKMIQVLMANQSPMMSYHQTTLKQ